MNESSLKWQTQRKRSNDNAVSPVIGTILMIAVTVALGAAVYTAVGGIGEESVDTDAVVFQASPADRDGDGSTDAVRITYVSGPNALPAGDVAVEFSAGTFTVASSTVGTAWNAQEYEIHEDDGTSTPTGTTITVTVRVDGTVVLDRPVTVDGW